MLNITEVTTRRDLTDFIKAPRHIYGDDAHYVPQLTRERLQHLGTKNPYFNHARAVYYIARDDQGAPVGRISAQIDGNAQREGWPLIGHFGLLEGADADTIHALLAQAESWLESRGAEHVYGPYSLSINDETGLLVEGHGKHPYMMMNYAPPFYAACLEKAGYEGAKDLLAYTLDLQQPMAAPIRRRARQALKNERLVERGINKRAFRQELQIVMRIFNEAWANNWGFVPMEADEIKAMAKAIRPLVDPDLIRIAEIDGRPAAMIVALPDLNSALKGLNGRLLPLGWARLLWRLKVTGLDKTRVLLMGVSDEWRDTPTGAGLSALMISRLHEELNKKGYRECELSWLLEDNDSIIRLIESTGAGLDKRYRIYHKELV